MRKIVIALTAAVLLVAGFAGPAAASCIQQTPEQQADAARIVATGTIIAMETAPAGGALVSAKLDWIYKGRPDNMLQFNIDSGGGVVTSVDVPLRVGSRYLFYMVFDGSQLTTNVCTGTREIGSNKKPAAPGAGPGYAPSTTAERPVDVPPYIPLLGLLVSVALIFGAIVLARNVGRKPPIANA